MEALHLLPEGELKILKQDISEIKALLESKQPGQFRWIESKNIPGILGISPKTWQNWRDKRIIPFSQFGAKIYVKMDDIDRLLEENKITSF